MPILKKQSTLTVILLTMGTLVMLWPYLKEVIYEQREAHVLEEYRICLEKMDLENQMKMARDYNQMLQKGDLIFDERYETILNVYDGIMGVITIPSISLELPIYHGVSEETLAKGAGHMSQSSLPVGGEGSHTVLSGHTGLPGAVLFTDLTKLKIGDMFYLSVLDETLSYKIDQIKIVLPDNGEDLTLVSGKDYCTLVTCTPYGINSHRLLIRGERTEKAEPPYG